MESFVRAWNEPNADARRQLLEACCTEDAELVDATAQVAGRAALHAHIGEVLAAAPGRALEATGRLEGFAGRRGFAWRLAAPDGRVTTGYSTLATAADGRLARIEVLASGAEPAPGRWAKTRDWAASNPLAVAGLLVLALYLALRFQAERFYGTFDATPEDAGFGNVELVMRQSTRVLLDFAIVGVTWGGLYLLGMVPVVYLLGVRHAVGARGRRWEPAAVLGLSFVALVLVAAGVAGLWPVAAAGVVLALALLAVPRWRYPDATKARADVRRRVARWSGWVIVVGSLAYGFVMLVPVGIEQADVDAANVHAGGYVTGDDFPWRALPVEVAWTVEEPPLALPGCADLAYLGETDRRVLLYDRRGDRTVRVASGDVELTFPQAARCR